MTTKNEEPVGKTVADKVGDAKQSSAAQADAAKDLAREALKQEARASTGTESALTAPKWQGSDEIQQYAYLLEGGFGLLDGALDKKDGIPEDKIAGLLILERNGQNRTEFVRAMMKRLGIKDLRKELPQAGGPDYTNDTTNLTDL